MVQIPGGCTVVGSYYDGFSPPHWVEYPDYLLSTTTTSVFKYEELGGPAGRKDAPDNHPITAIRFNYDILTYLRHLRERWSEESDRVPRLPDRVEWENGGRGPANDLREVIRKEKGEGNNKLSLSQFLEVVWGRYENIVEGVGSEPLLPEAAYERLYKKGKPMFGWPLYATPSGKLVRDEVWMDQGGTAPARWGPKCGYGVFGMTGGVFEWIDDYYSTTAGSRCNQRYRSIRGGSWRFADPLHLMLGTRFYANPFSRLAYLGFRIAASDLAEGDVNDDAVTLMMK